MSEEEKEERYTKIRDIVLHQTGEQWCKVMIEEIEKAHKEHQQQDKSSIPRLNVRKLKELYMPSKRRVFFLDYEGTLASFSSPNNVHLSSPQRVLDALNTISLDHCNEVYVMSGMQTDEMDLAFARVRGIGMIAENGCFVKQPNGTWKPLADPAQMTAWKGTVKEVLEYYKSRVAGSQVDEKKCSFTFRYDEAEDQELASRLASEIANHINEACNKQRVHAVPRDKSILIEPIDFTKASASKDMLDELSEDTENKPDFLFVAGNDREDEVVFRWANELGQKGEVQNVMTVSLGKRNTEAMATLTQGTTSLITVLQRLAKR